jgi:hypothetical protein
MAPRRRGGQGPRSAAPRGQPAPRARPPRGGASGRTTIDDLAAAARLMDEMRAHLPIPVSGTPELLRMLRDRGLSAGGDQPLFVKELFYMGDEGGICCDVTSSGETKAALVVSLTHLRIAADHPLSGRILTYQRQRVARIAASPP